MLKRLDDITPSTTRAEYAQLLHTLAERTHHEQTGDYVAAVVGHLVQGGLVDFDDQLTVADKHFTGFAELGHDEDKRSFSDFAHDVADLVAGQGSPEDVWRQTWINRPFLAVRTMLSSLRRIEHEASEGKMSASAFEVFSGIAPAAAEQGFLDATFFREASARHLNKDEPSFEERSRAFGRFLAEIIGQLEQYQRDESESELSQFDAIRLCERKDLSPETERDLDEAREIIGRVGNSTPLMPVALQLALRTLRALAGGLEANRVPLRVGVDGFLEMAMLLVEHGIIEQDQVKAILSEGGDPEEKVTPEELAKTCRRLADLLQHSITPKHVH